jgi:hypothetical protein
MPADISTMKAKRVSSLLAGHPLHDGCMIDGSADMAAPPQASEGRILEGFRRR